ncbi:hypothetical protein KI387_002835 [Taxus chinensis]|uniref:LOB domain-containing protein n=1 Tax=Taxus chinensis TaxID=29808 RepID=A0AA38LRF5_TAXCH|nr:hypothetical protein KI387_002835 [Taxus chinensis]
MESTPCAACKWQRKKCFENCVLAPHFPKDDPEKFAIVHSVYGTNNIIKMLQGVEDYQREKAAESIVYEARARANHPIHGTTSAIGSLKKRIMELENQLRAAQEDLVNMRSECDNLEMLMGTGSEDAYRNPTYPEQIEDMMYEVEHPFVLWGS